MNPPRRPRIRFSLRTLFVLVTVVAIGCLLWQRRTEFLRRASAHAASSEMFKLFASDPGFNSHHRYHERLSMKYTRAAKYPWLPVEPDPPEPPGNPIFGDTKKPDTPEPTP